MYAGVEVPMPKNPLLLNVILVVPFVVNLMGALFMIEEIVAAPLTVKLDVVTSDEDTTDVV